MFEDLNINFNNLFIELLDETFDDEINTIHRSTFGDIRWELFYEILLT
jgi:hypothetical protein